MRPITVSLEGLGRRASAPDTVSSAPRSRSADYTVAAALAGVCVVVGAAVLLLNFRESKPSVPQALPEAAPQPAAAVVADAAPDWQGQIDKQLGRIEEERQRERSRADADSKRLQQLEQQRLELEKQRRELSRSPVPSVQPPVASASQAPAGPSPAVATIASPAVTRLPAKIDTTSCKEPEYPERSMRLGESGTVRIAYDIDETGKVLGSRIDGSSGSERLDSAAQRALSKCRFTPGTADGVPERSWATVRFTWRLQ